MTLKCKIKVGILKLSWEAMPRVFKTTVIWITSIKQINKINKTWLWKRSIKRQIGQLRLRKLINALERWNLRIIPSQTKLSWAALTLLKLQAAPWPPSKRIFKRKLILGANWATSTKKVTKTRSAMLQVQTVRRPSILQISRVSQELKSKEDVEGDLQRRNSSRCWR